MSRSYAGILGLVALVTSLVRSVRHGGAVDESLLQAWLALLVFAALGMFFGWVADRTVQEAVRQRITLELAAQAKSAATAKKT